MAPCDSQKILETKEYRSILTLKADTHDQVIGTSSLLPGPRVKHPIDQGGWWSTVASLTYLVTASAASGAPGTVLRRGVREGMYYPALDRKTWNLNKTRRHELA